MTSITPVNFTGNPNKSFEVFSQQVLKGAKKGQNTNLKDFTHNLTSFTDSFEANKDGVNVSVALQYTDSYSENIISFVNNVKTADGGTHEVGFKTAITKVLNDYAKENNFLKSKEK